MSISFQSSNWFSSLTGFLEENPEQVRSLLRIQGDQLISTKNKKSYTFGQLTTPSLGELRKASGWKEETGTLTVSELIGDVKTFHTDPDHAGALFQAASQFNLLEMVGPHVSPERGVGIYENDDTQGPACAIAAGAGTIYRNYFADVNGQVGQTSDRQIDCLRELGIALGNEDEQFWHMQNGYALMKSEKTLQEVVGKISRMKEAEKDALREKLRIGVQWNTQVTQDNCQHLVSQAYCSALPVAYNDFFNNLWEAFARLVLEASYEATLHAGLLNYKNTGNPQVFLTYIGGGVFGNFEEWIFDAIKRALYQFKNTPLHVCFISFGGPHPLVAELIST